MDYQATSGFFKWLETRLAQKHYAPLPTIDPLDVAFLKHGSLNLPRVVAAVETAHVTNTPTEILQQVENWFKQIIGTGNGVLLFVYHSPPAVTTIEEIQNISGQVVAGAHDLHTGRHWLSNYMGFEQDIYGE